jgi:uncharacterized protein YukE
MTNQMNEQQLLQLKRQIDDAKSETAELKGREKQLMDQLQTEWKCKTVKQAEQKCSALQDEITQIDSQIDEGTKELEEKYDV